MSLLVSDAAHDFQQHKAGSKVHNYNYVETKLVASKVHNYNYVAETKLVASKVHNYNYVVETKLVASKVHNYNYVETKLVTVCSNAEEMIVFTWR